MKVSVIIPAFNEEEHIGKCLQSIINQDEKPDEIIVVDNNCTDKTAEIAKKFGAIVVKEKKQGMIYSRNAGFDAAKYEILARTDADTILPKDWILKIKKAFEDPNLGGLSGPASYFKSPIMSYASKTGSYILFGIVGLILGHSILLGPNMIIRNSLWKKIRKNVCLIDKEVHEDIDLSIHLSKIGKIKFDKDFTIITTRGRWLKIFTEYTVRLIKMILSHKINLKLTK